MLVDIQKSGTETDYDESNNFTEFAGSTIYGYGLKSKKNIKKKVKLINFCIKISIMTSMVSLITITILLAFFNNNNTCELNQFKEHKPYFLKNTNPTTYSDDDTESELNVYRSCKGIVYSGYCYTFNSEPKSFNDAYDDCEKKNSELPSNNLMNDWISDYLDGTWGEDGNVLFKEKNQELEAIDISDEMRSYYCVRSFF
ncbi:EEV membrane phosphoglycoprotein [Goatpox virus]|uniref:Protein OPG161 n=1 Tax=Goatpox virus TaxID=186805 RepID=A0A5C0PT30_9POXV|nr:EEV membrane phosphoglycoprotein [Goatpox virus]